MTSNAHFEVPLFNDAFGFSRYPTFKTKNTNTPTMPCGRGHSARGRGLLALSNRVPPYGSETCCCPRNVSEPQLISSTNHMRDSWFTSLKLAYTVGDIGVIRGTSSVQSWYDADDGHIQETLGPDEGSRDSPLHLEQINGNCEEDSLYSTSSADQDSHPLLLSTPIIPQIKLQRKATIRKPDPEPVSDPMQDQFLLSPLIQDFRIPARLSRHLGRAPPRIGPQEATSDVHQIAIKNGDQVAQVLQAPRRYGSISSNDVQSCIPELAYMRSTSETAPNSPYILDDERVPLLKKGTGEPPHFDDFLSLICEESSFHRSHIDTLEADIESLKKSPNKQPGRSHRRSSLNHSISFSGIFHAVAERCASLDLLRRPKTKHISTAKAESDGFASNAPEISSKWVPKEGRIIIKVFVPSTDDIWKFRVPQDISLTDFTSKVVTKLELSVSFSGSLWDEPKYYFATDERFKAWVKGRIRSGRNLPIVAHVPPPLPLVRLSVDEDGCEVWCYT